MRLRPFALANHHDNFDCYDSTYHAWNSVNIGPKKDIIGTWAKVAREAGLRFGVTNHCSHAWHWLQTAYGYDATGDLAGKRYDAFTLTKEDGKGKWWEGLDPQDLYTGPNIVIPDGFTDIKKMNAWHGARGVLAAHRITEIGVFRTLAIGVRASRNASLARDAIARTLRAMVEEMDDEGRLALAAKRPARRKLRVAS